MPGNSKNNSQLWVFPSARESEREAMSILNVLLSVNIKLISPFDTHSLTQLLARLHTYGKTSNSGSKSASPSSRLRYDLVPENKCIFSFFCFFFCWFNQQKTTRAFSVFCFRNTTISADIRITSPFPSTSSIFCLDHPFWLYR